MTDEFGGIQFSGNLRPSQVASSSVIRKDLEGGSKELLIVAPLAPERQCWDYMSGPT